MALRQRLLFGISIVFATILLGVGISVALIPPAPPPLPQSESVEIVFPIEDTEGTHTISVVLTSSGPFATQTEITATDIWASGPLLLNLTANTTVFMEARIASQTGVGSIRIVRSFTVTEPITIDPIIEDVLRPPTLLELANETLISSGFLTFSTAGLHTTQGVISLRVGDSSLEGLQEASVTIKELRDPVLDQVSRFGLGIALMAIGLSVPSFVRNLLTLWREGG